MIRQHDMCERSTSGRPLCCSQNKTYPADVHVTLLRWSLEARAQEKPFSERCSRKQVDLKLKSKAIVIQKFDQPGDIDLNKVVDVGATCTSRQI